MSYVLQADVRVTVSVMGRPVCFLVLTSMVCCVVQLDRVRKRVADRKIKIEVTESAIKLLGVMGYDPAYGARPVKVSPRVLELFLCGLLAAERVHLLPSRSCSSSLLAMET